MRKIAAGVSVAIVVGIVTIVELTTRRPEPPQEPRSSRRIIGRVVGEDYAPRRVTRGGLEVEDFRFELPPPEDADPEDRGRLLLIRGETSEAIPDLRRVAESGEPEALTNLAAGLVTQADRGDSRSALEAVTVAQQAVDRAPGLAAAHFNLALALENLGRAPEAYKEFLTAARLDGESKWAREALDRARDLFEFVLEDQQIAIDSSLADVRASLAPHAAILRYATVMDHAVVFVVRRDSVEVVDLANVEDLASLAAKLRVANDASFGQWASLLYERAVAPVLPKLGGISTIAVVRNSELADIPFGALFDAQRGEYLAQRYTIVHAPTAKAAIELSSRAREVGDATLLAIGATEFDRARYASAEVLPSVNREVADIAAQSLCARVLSGPQATPEAIRQQVAESTVIHYGGHIVRRGGDAYLLLAPSGGRDSLSATEIARFRLEKPRVAVLAGCGGAPTMADAFLAAGVPTVIATAYALEDSEAPPTMRRLHFYLRQGYDGAEALRRTTLDELEAGRGVPLSIRFQAIGGASGLVIESRGRAAALQTAG